MNIVQELIYIIGGLALTHIFIGFYKLLVTIGQSKAINPAYFLFAFLSPFVIWQYIYTFARHIDAIQGATSGYGFLTSLCVLLTLSILVGLAFVIFPDNEVYSTEDAAFTAHLKSNRRPFYLLVIMYVCSLFIGDEVIGLPIPDEIFTARAFIIAIALGVLILNFEVKTYEEYDEVIRANKVIKVELLIRIRYPTWPKRESNLHGLDLMFPKKYWQVTEVVYKDEKEAEKARALNYDYIDLGAAIAFILLFIVIAIIRSYK